MGESAWKTRAACLRSTLNDMPIMNEFKILYKYLVITQYFTHRPRSYKACKAPQFELKRIFSSCFYKILHKESISILQFNQYYHTINTSSEILLTSSSASFPFCFLNPVLDTCIRLLEQRQQFPHFTHSLQTRVGNIYWVFDWKSNEKSCRFT